MGRSLTAWWFTPAARARLALVRAVIYVFIPVDMLLITNEVLIHAQASARLYKPIYIARVLHMPAPDKAWVYPLAALIILAATVAAAGRLPRIAGWSVAVGYWTWMIIAMSYGRTDHDHLALAIAVAVLPTLGKAGWRDTTPSAEAGWILRCIQVAVVLTYTLSVIAKVRFGGWDWATGGTFEWAMRRLGTPVGQVLLDAPILLQASQWALVALELAAPLLLFTRGRVLAVGLITLVGFHLVTYVTLRIGFWSHMICFVAFIPLERLTSRTRPLRGGQRAGGRTSGEPVTVVGD